jgi:alkanesulfonate monooxygenase SsuD/methylene tetrahydromethanopterin reductase-like flavin-dependent oxidoreductase (luciferase family)
MSAESAQQVAANGLGLMLARSASDPHRGTDELQLPLAAVYLEGWDSRNGTPRIGLSRTVYPAADKATALRAMQEGVMRNVRSLIAQGQLPPDLSLEQYCARLNIVYGHPQEIVQTLRADRVLSSATDLIVQFSPAEPSHQDALRMLEQIAIEVAPHLR